MPSEPFDCRIQRLVMLAETKAREMPRGLGRIIVKRADWYRRSPRLHRDVPAEILVGAIEAERPKIGRNGNTMPR